MNRLTKKVGENYCSQSGDFYDLYNKLGKLEDLENRIGCPLEIILKIMLKEIDTIFVIYGDGGYNSPYDDIIPANVDGLYDMKNYLDLESLWVIETNLCPIPLKDYKMTWWLNEDKSE